MKEKCAIYDFNDEIIDIEDLLNEIQRLCYYSTNDEKNQLKQEISFIVDKILIHLDRVKEAYIENNDIYEERIDELEASNQDEIINELIDELEAEASKRDEIINELKGGK